jgi:glycosyltransferase involved in cell wall biosynthesis
MSPVFSIVLCTFNAQAYLDECIQSLLQQTFRDFELIIVDDGSQDGTLTYLEALTDPRIRLIPLTSNRGLIFARSAGFEAARGLYTAIMDADDIAHPRRLEEQFRVLNSGEADVCGSFHITLDTKSGRRRSRKSAFSDSDIRALLTIYCPLCNPSTSLLTTLIQKHHYNTGYPHAEDYGLWCEIAAQGGRFKNINMPLLTYRLHPGQISVVKKDTANNSFRTIQAKYVQALTGNDLVPQSMPFKQRCNDAVGFMKTINQKIPGVSFGANYQLYAEFQYRRNGWLTLLLRLERVAIALWATHMGHHNKSRTKAL